MLGLFEFLHKKKKLSKDCKRMFTVFKENFVSRRNLNKLSVTYNLILTQNNRRIRATDMRMALL